MASAWRSGIAAWVVEHLTSRGSVNGEVAVWHAWKGRDWLQAARERAAEGEFQLALKIARAALQRAPGDLDLLNLEGNMDESLLQFGQAQNVYTEMLRKDPGNPQAKENMVFCQRVNRYHSAPGAHLSTLYGLHHLMLAQGRIDEALVLSRRLDKDRALQQVTWQAALDETGLVGTATVDEAGRLTLNIAGSNRPDLALIRRFPVAKLKASYAELEDIQALKGMPLEELDLTGTTVYNLAPLRGMPLKVLHIAGTGVVDLGDLTNCPLRELDISRTRIGNVIPLANLPLEILRADDTPVADLHPLAVSPIRELSLCRTKISDISPLALLPLQKLAIDGTVVSDLSPLRGATLRELRLSMTKVSDLTPLAHMPLQLLTLAYCFRTTDLRPLTSCLALEHLTLPPSPLYLEALSNLPHIRTN